MKFKPLFISFFVFSLLVTPLEAAIFKDFSGKPTTLENYIGKGKWLVVMIWRSDCHICNQEAGSYAAFHQKSRDKGVMVLGLSMDGQAKQQAARAFIKRHSLPFPNLIGEPQDVAIWFTNLTGVQWGGTPTFLIYSPDGELAVQQAGAVPVNLIEEFIQQQQKIR